MTPRLSALEPAGPLSYSYDPSRVSSVPHGIAAAALTGSTNHRLFVYMSNHFMSLLPDGRILWDKPFGGTSPIPVFCRPSWSTNLDGDGTKEILVPGTSGLPGRQGLEFVKSSDGTSFNANWPYTFPFERNDYTHLNKLHAADVDGDGVKEVVFVKPGKRALVNMAR